MRVGFAVVVAAVAFAGSARAAPTSRLTYVRGPGAQACPDEATLRRAVADRLGYDPFFPTANRTIVAQIQRGPRGYAAELKILDDAGVSLGERALPTTTSDCGEVVKSLALAISIAIDDLETAAPPAEPPKEPARTEPPPPDGEATPPAPPAPATLTPDKTATPQESPRALGVALEVDGLGIAASAPAPTAGLGVGASLLWDFWSFGVAGRLELPASDAIPGGGRIETARALGLVSACAALPGERWRPFACALGALGSFRATTREVSAPRAASALFAGAGARVGASVLLFGPLYAFGAVSALGSFTPHRTYMNGAVVFTAPTVSLDVGAGLGVQILR